MRLLSRLTILSSGLATSALIVQMAGGGHWLLTVSLFVLFAALFGALFGTDLMPDAKTSRKSFGEPSPPRAKGMEGSHTSPKPDSKET